ncbi:MAG: hypothetical protein L0Z62_50960, partial [Gemmataceae bacterium]|nr:hypothetical protein [Gemmataceae bacterium]
MLAVTSLLGGSSVAVGYAVQAGREHQAAEKARQQEAEARGAAQRQLVDLCVSSGLAASRQNEQAQALLWFARAVQLAENEPEEQRLHRIRAANWLRFVPQPTHAFQLPDFRPQRDRLRTLAYHPFGRHLLAVTTADRVVLWDLEREQELALPGGNRPLVATEFSPDGHLLVLVPPQGTAELYHFESLQAAETLEGPGNLRAVAFSPDGRHLALGGAAGARVWDCRGRTWVTPVLPHPRGVLSLAFSPSGRRLATAGNDGLGRVFAVQAGEQAGESLFPPVPHNTGRAGFAPVFVHGDDEVLTVDAARVVSWRDAATGKLLRLLPSAPTRIQLIRLCPRGRQLAVLWDGLGRFWDLSNPKEPQEVRSGDLFAPRDVTFDPAGQVVLIAQEDGRIGLWPSDRDLLNIWNHTLWTAPHEVIRHPAGVLACRFAPLADGFVTVQTDGQVVVWQLPPREPLAYVCPTGGTTRVHLSPDGARMLPSGVSYRNGTLRTTRVHDTATRRPLGPALDPGGLVLDAVFSPDGESVAIASSAATEPAPRLWPAVRPNSPAGSVQVWNWRTGERRFAPVAMPTEPRGLAFSPDGTLLAVACANGGLALLRSADGQVVHRLDTGQRWNQDANEWHANGLVRFAPDGRAGPGALRERQLPRVHGPRPARPRSPGPSPGA